MLIKQFGICKAGKFCLILYFHNLVEDRQCSSFVFLKNLLPTDLTKDLILCPFSVANDKQHLFERKY